jgi:hypothetical protein
MATQPNQGSWGFGISSKPVTTTPNGPPEMSVYGPTGKSPPRTTPAETPTSLSKVPIKSVYPSDPSAQTTVEKEKKDWEYRLPKPTGHNGTYTKSDLLRSEAVQTALEMFDGTVIDVRIPRN